MGVGRGDNKLIPDKYIVMKTSEPMGDPHCCSVSKEVYTPRYIHTYILMELSPTGGAANSAATQEFPSILWNPKVHYRVPTKVIKQVICNQATNSVLHQYDVRVSDGSEQAYVDFGFHGGEAVAFGT
jgi:hypothetical protein